MKVIYFFIKNTIEQIRNPWELLITLLIAPGFVLLYWGFFGGGSTTYRVLVVNLDKGVCPIEVSISDDSCASGVISAIESLQYENGDPMLRVCLVPNRDLAEEMLRDKKAEALIIIPDNFSQAIIDARTSQKISDQPIILVGDLTNTYYSVAVIFASSAIEDFISQAVGTQEIFTFVEETLSKSSARSEFELYVPGLMVVSVIMVIFPVSLAIAREIESGVLQRLRMSGIKSLAILSGISISFVGTSFISLLLAFTTAALLGYQSQGALWLGIFISLLHAISMIGIGLITASFARTTAFAAIICNVPLLLFMFFSGAVFPIPDIVSFELGGHDFGLLDLLSSSHTVVALNKVLTLGVGFEEVIYEISATFLLAMIYFFTGVWLFNRIHIRSL